MARTLLVEKLNPAEKSLFMQFLKERYPEKYRDLVSTGTWVFFKMFYDRLLNELWLPFHKWLKQNGLRDGIA